jgi:ketosteroid isomerase-like protein
MEAMTRASGRDVLERFLAAAERHDFDAAREFLHPDVVMEWPQSGERFTGVDNAIGAVSATEQKPEIVGEPRVIGEGSVWVLTMPLRYGPEIAHYVGVFELEDGRIRRSTEYFGAPFPAAENRAPFADAATAS